jgi:hypothetical protein
MEFTKKLRNAIEKIPGELIAPWITELWLEREVIKELGPHAVASLIEEFVWAIVLENIEIPENYA